MARLPPILTISRERFFSAAAVAGRWVAGGALAAAGFLKLRSPAEEFAAALEVYRLFPAGWVFPIARSLPWVEYLLGLYLVAGLWLRYTAPAALVLYGGFVLALSSALLRGIDLSSCGCFGGAWPLPPEATLAVDSLCVLLLASAVLDRRSRLSIDRWSGAAGR